MEDPQTEKLLKAFPELDKPYKDLKRIYKEGEQMGSYVSFGMILEPYLKQVFQTNDIEFLQRVFDFMEDLAVNPDLETKNLLQLTICEFLMSNPDFLKTSEDYIGPKLKKILTRHQTGEPYPNPNNKSKKS